MAHKHPIDHLFHQKLKNASQTPSPQAWERLEELLDTQQHTIQTKKRGAWMWVAASVLLLAMGYASWNYLGDVKKIAIDKENKNIHHKKNNVEQLQSKNLKESKKNEVVLPNLNSTEDRRYETNNTVPYSLEQKEKNDNQIPLKKQENETQLPIELPIQQKQENQVALGNKTKENVKSNPLENEKIVVTVKISSHRKSNTDIANADNLIAERTRPKRKAGKVIESIRNFKNRDADEERKIFGVDKEKLMASIGKE